MNPDDRTEPEGVGCVFVPVFILITAVIIWSLGCRPADALECPPMVARWCPPVPPPAVPTPQIVAVVDTEEEVRVIAAHFWPAWAVERMVRIAGCESRFWEDAVNPTSGAAGIWQVMPGWKRLWPGDHLDPWVNGAVAYQIWLVQGFSAWVCRG